MPVSVTADPPRLHALRTYSNGSIHIDREVSVVSSPDTDSPTKIALPTLEKMASGQARPQSSYANGSTRTPTAQLRRGKSETRISDRMYSLDSKMEAKALLDSNRESMKALSEFLMTKDPPPSNWASFPPEDEKGFKDAAFKFFGRNRSKSKSKKWKLLKLPDSAVAATTSSGSRHIAISIPLDAWPGQDFPTPPSTASSRTQSRLPSERPTITILKPVVEVREPSPTSTFTSLNAKEATGSASENRISRADSDNVPASEILGPEATKTLENYYLQLNRQQKRDSTASSKAGPSSRSQRTYVVMPPTEVMARQDSQRTTYRSSSGTMYSTASTKSPNSHSRGASSASTAPSATTSVPRKLDLPARTSSLTKISPAVLSELAQIANEKHRDEPRDSIQSAKSGDRGSILSNTTISQSPPIVYGTADVAQSYAAGAADLQHVRGSTPKPPSPAPTKKLPDIPSSRSTPPPRQTTPVPVKETPTRVAITSPARKAAQANAEESLQVTRQNRQDRVKARKMRDMEILREKSSATRLPLENTTGNSPSRIPSPPAAPPRSTKRQSASQDLNHKKSTIVMSPIMLVASTSPSGSPSTTPAQFPSPPPPQSSLHIRKSRNIPIPPSSFTPPKPPSTSTNTSHIGSDSDTIPPSSIKKRASDLSTQSSKTTSLETRRQDRRAKRNMSLKEKELELRLQKIEKDNLLLLNTLSGIAGSFQELQRLYPRDRRGSPRLLEGSARGGDSGEEAGLEV